MCPHPTRRCGRHTPMNRTTPPGPDDLPAAARGGSYVANAHPSPDFADYQLDEGTPTDPGLQAWLEQLDAGLRRRHDMRGDQAAAGLLDLRRMQLAMVRPDRIEYGASLPKIGILLAWFALRSGPESRPDARTRHELGLMIKNSSDAMATRFSRELGLERIQQVLNARGFYDPARGGGIWVGKHYGAEGERRPDPVGGHSHAVTVRQVLRFYLLLEQGRLLSPAASRAMREIFESPGLPQDPIKFVAALAGREVQLIRKWGSWQDWLHDSAVVTGPGRHYILVGLTRHARGDDYLADLARHVDDRVTGS